MARVVGSVKMPELSYDPGRDSPQDKVYEALQATSDALPLGEVQGFLVNFPQGDGYACYRVKSAKPLTLEHVPFGDAWQADAITIRGLRLQDVLYRQKADAQLRKMFPNTKVG